MEVSKKCHVFCHVLNNFGFLIKGKFIRSNSISAYMRFRTQRYVAASHSGPFSFDPFILATKAKFVSVSVLIMNPICVTIHISILSWNA